MNLKAEIDYDSAEAGDEGEIGKLISICLYVLEKQGKQSKIPHHDKKQLEKIANQVKSWFGHVNEHKCKETTAPAPIPASEEVSFLSLET